MSIPRGTQIPKKPEGIGRMRTGIVLGVPIVVIIELVLASSLLG